MTPLQKATDELFVAAYNVVEDYYPSSHDLTRLRALARAVDKYYEISLRNKEKLYENDTSSPTSSP